MVAAVEADALAVPPALRLVLYGVVESDHDLRNSADMLIVDRIAKDVFHIPSIARVQTITRPLGTPIEHTSIPFQISQQGTTQQLNQTDSEDRTADLLVQAEQTQPMIDTMETCWS